MGNTASTDGEYISYIGRTVPDYLGVWRYNVSY